MVISHSYVKLPEGMYQELVGPTFFSFLRFCFGFLFGAMADPFLKDTPGRLSQIWNGPSNQGTPQSFARSEYSLHEKQAPGSCQALSIRAEKPLKTCPSISKIS